MELPAGPQHAPRLALQPALHGVAHTRFGRAARQTDVQRTWLGVVEHDLAFGQAVAAVELQRDGATEIVELRAVGPDHASGIGAQASLALLGELGEDPAALPGDGGVDVPERHPLRRAHGETLGTHDEADRAAARAAQCVEHVDAVDACTAIRARVGQRAVDHRRLRCRHRRGLGLHGRDEGRRLVEQASLQRVDEAPSQLLHEAGLHLPA